SRASAPHTFSLDTADTKSADSRVEPRRIAVVPVPAARPQRPAPAPVLAPATGADAASTPANAERDQWVVASLAEPRPRAAAQPVPRVPLSQPDRSAVLAPWPIRDLQMDRVPLDMVLAYAAQPQGEGDADLGGRAEPAEERPVRVAASDPTRTRPLRESDVVAPKKILGRTAGVRVVRVRMVARPPPGTRYDDPWLGAIILAPRLYNAMTATLYGEPDFTALRALMNKPTISVAMSFANEPYPGITANGFSGEAVVILNTFAFQQRTAWLH